jgi:hypothetical protein
MNLIFAEKSGQDGNTDALIEEEQEKEKERWKKVDGLMSSG